LNVATRRSFDNAHGRCATGSKKIAESGVRIVPLADSSWIKQKKKVFLFLFFKKRNALEKELANKLHCNPGFSLSLNPLVLNLSTYFNP
jgi:hypothetical protein